MAEQHLVGGQCFQDKLVAVYWTSLLLLQGQTKIISLLQGFDI